MESLDLSCNFGRPKNKNKKTPDQIYFMPQVYQEHSHCYDKGKKINSKLGKFFFFFHATFSLSGRGVLLQPRPPPTVNFWNFFLGIWTQGW